MPSEGVHGTGPLRRSFAEEDRQGGFDCVGGRCVAVDGRGDHRGVLEEVGVGDRDEHGRQAVPGDLAVIGVDDIPFAALVSPALTSVRLPVDAMAQELIRQLADGRAACAVQAVEPGGPVLILCSSS